MSQPIPAERDVRFEGNLIFDLSFVLLGRTAVRKLRVDYGYRPEWDYFDTETGSIVSGGPEEIQTVLWLQVTPPDNTEGSYWEDSRGRRIEAEGLLHSDGKPRAWQDWTDPRWVRADTLNELHVLPFEMWDLIDAAIDDRCRVEDERGRVERPGAA